MEKMMWYLNNAGAGIPSDPTHEAVIQHLNLERTAGAYDAAKQKKSEYDAFYERAATLVGATSSEIAFMDSASRAWNAALAAIGMKHGDKVVTLSSEFGTNLVSLFRMAGKNSAEVVVVHCKRDGSFDFREFEDACRGASLIAISHSAAHGSIVNPVNEIGVVAKREGARYLVDGCQAVGQIQVNVATMGCDAYTATGRKWLRGPRGTGFLYVRRNSDLVTTEVDLSSADLEFANTDDKVTGVIVRDDARQFELWERSVASMLGLSVALREAIEEMDSGSLSRIGEYGDRIRSAVTANPKLALIGREQSPVGNVGFYCVDPADEKDVHDALSRHGIVYSSMSDWDFPLHFPKNGATQVFRLSPHYYSTEGAVAAAIEALAGVN